MSSRLAVPHADPIPWLLEGDDPSVRFFTLTELLGSSPDSPDAVAARREIMTLGAGPLILDAQRDEAPTATTSACDAGVRRSCATHKTPRRAASP